MSLDCWGFCLDWGGSGHGFRVPEIGGNRESRKKGGREEMRGGLIWFDCLGKADFGSRFLEAGWERGWRLPARRGKRTGAKGTEAGLDRQGVAGQPGASMTVTVSLPCKPPTG